MHIQLMQWYQNKGVTITMNNGAVKKSFSKAEYKNSSYQQPEQTNNRMSRAQYAATIAVRFLFDNLL